MPQLFDPEFIHHLTDGDAFEAAARKAVAESDRKEAENRRFRKDNPHPFEGLRACLNLAMILVAVPSFLFALLSILFGKAPPDWSMVALSAALFYLYVPWPKGPPLPHSSGILSESSRKALLANSSHAAGNNSRVIEKLSKSGGYVLFLRSFDAEFREAWRTEDLKSDLKDEPYRVKEYAPDAEIRLLNELVTRTRIPSVTNLLVQVPELASAWTCEVLHLPTASWLECVIRLATGAKATIFVISSQRGSGITQELDSLQQRRLPVMAICENCWLKDYVGHLPENVLAVTDTRYEYDHTDPPTTPVGIRIKSAVTEEELQEYERRLHKLLTEPATNALSKPNRQELLMRAVLEDSLTPPPLDTPSSAPTAEQFSPEDGKLESRT